MDVIRGEPVRSASTPLSAPVSEAQNQTLSLVIVIVASVSAVGAAWMIMGFALNKSLRTFRHQLILGLAISDFFMAINFLSSAAVSLTGVNIGAPRQEMYCSFNGFMTQTFVDQTDYWVLSIAGCTFIMLNEKTTISQWIQKNRAVVWAVPWILSLLWATLGFVLAGYGDIGAWCWFTSDRTRLLVNFLPRWIIIVLMLGLYARLHYIIHRAHHNLHCFDDEYGTSFRSIRLSTRPYPQSINLTKVSDGSDLERIIPETTSPPRLRQRERSSRATDLRRIAYQMMLYPLAYMLIWALPTSIRIYQAASGKPASFSVATVDKCCIVIQGLVDAIVYGFNERTWRGWKQLFTRKNGI